MKQTINLIARSGLPSALGGVESLSCRDPVATLGSGMVAWFGVTLRLLSRRSGWLAGAVTMGLGLLASPSAAQQSDSISTFADSVAVREGEIAAGRKVFRGKGTCFACHGARLEGTAIAPTLRNHKWRNGDGSLVMILRVLRRGVPNTLMVSRPGNISEAELLEVASYVWAVSRGAAEP